MTGLCTNRGCIALDSIGLNVDQEKTYSTRQHWAATHSLTGERYDQANPRYFYEAMRSDLVQQQIVNQDAGSAMNFYGIGGTKKFILPVPPLSEQREIAEALSECGCSNSILRCLDHQKTPH